MNLQDFHYAMSLMHTMYDIEMPEDIWEEIALTGWNLIGNKRCKIYRLSTSVSDCSNSVTLPCNLCDLEAVTINEEDWNYSTNDSPNGKIDSAYTESYIEHRKDFKQPLYCSGKLIPYERVGNKLFFDRPYGKINILYKGLVADDEGLPQIADKEAMALATYCAYVQKFKEGLRTNNANMLQIANTLKAKWDVQCDQARIDHYMSQNDWNNVLDAKTQWNRKQYNKSYKLYN